MKWSTFSWAIITSKLTSESTIHLPFKSMEVSELIKWVLDVSLKQLGLNPGHTEADGKKKLEFHSSVYASSAVLAKITTKSASPWRQS